MESKANTAVDIIYTIPDRLELLLNKIAALETRNAMLEHKLNTLIIAASAPPVAPQAEYAEQQSTVPADDAPDSSSEVMEIRSKAPKKPAEPFNFGKPLQQKDGESVSVSVSSATPLVIEPPKQEPDGIRIPIKSVDPLPQSAIQAEAVPEKNTATLIRGRLKDRDGASVAAVDVKIFDEKNVMVKKTKTAATGEWIAMLPAGEYTVEFTKPGQKPLFKPISVVSGKKEIEVLI